MLGSIISRIKVGNEELQDILLFEEDDRLWKTSYIQYYLSGIMCKNIFGGEEINDESQGCYIMTLGIIDECRKIGLGSLLLEETFK